jgi:hypothetical protein
MFHLSCFLCRQEVAGELGQMRKHIKNEHDTVKYRVEVVLALGFLGPGEQEQLLGAVRERMDGFERSGEVNTGGDIFSNRGDREDVQEYELEGNQTHLEGDDASESGLSDENIQESSNEVHL